MHTGAVQGPTLFVRVEVIVFGWETLEQERPTGQAVGTPVDERRAGFADLPEGTANTLAVPLAIEDAVVTIQLAAAATIVLAVADAAPASIAIGTETGAAVDGTGRRAPANADARTGIDRGAAQGTAYVASRRASELAGVDLRLVLAFLPTGPDRPGRKGEARADRK
jgi:hypothetical protein